LKKSYSPRGRRGGWRAEGNDVLLGTAYKVLCERTKWKGSPRQKRSGKQAGTQQKGLVWRQECAT